MIATKQYIAHLLHERARYARVFGLDESRTVFNPLLRYHIRGMKENRHTLRWHAEDLAPKEQGA